MGSPLFNDNEKKRKKRLLCFLNDEMLKFIMVAFESISTQLFQLFQVDYLYPDNLGFDINGIRGVVTSRLL